MAPNLPHERPYEFENVCAILIRGMSDFVEIEQGSLEEGEVALDAGERPIVRKTLTATDGYARGERIFLFADELVAVRFLPDRPTIVPGGGESHPKIARPLP